MTANNPTSHRELLTQYEAGRVVTLGDPVTEAHRCVLNERGRAMTVRVKIGDFGDACTVQAVLTGPDTVDEGFMTKLEAEALRDCLSAALAESQPQ